MFSLCLLFLSSLQNQYKLNHVYLLQNSLSLVVTILLKTSLVLMLLPSLLSRHPLDTSSQRHCLYNKYYHET